MDGPALSSNGIWEIKRCSLALSKKSADNFWEKTAGNAQKRRCLWKRLSRAFLKLCGLATSMCGLVIGLVRARWVLREPIFGSQCPLLTSGHDDRLNIDSTLHIGVRLRRSGARDLAGAGLHPLRRTAFPCPERMGSCLLLPPPPERSNPSHYGSSMISHASRRTPPSSTPSRTP